MRRRIWGTEMVAREVVEECHLRDGDGYSEKWVRISDQVVVGNKA
jgi:hypothetical protein